MFRWVVGITVAFVLWSTVDWAQTWTYLAPIIGFTALILLIVIGLEYWYRKSHMKPDAVESPRGTTSAAVPSGTMAEVVRSETSHLAASPFNNQAPSTLDVQADVVIGKGRKTLALIQNVSIWYEVDENHSDAIAKSEQLRTFLRQFRDEWDSLIRLRSGNPQSPGDGDIQKFGEAADLKKRIDSKLRQLQAMGFSD